jgi:hypothetical protein
MSFTSRSLRALVPALGLLGLGLASTGCADLTRPDEIVIIAEPPPAPKAPAPVAAVASDEGEPGTSGAARAPGKKKAGG